jgi:hypothetical protein
VKGQHSANSYFEVPRRLLDGFVVKVRVGDAVVALIDVVVAVVDVVVALAVVVVVVVVVHGAGCL